MSALAGSVVVCSAPAGLHAQAGRPATGQEASRAFLSGAVIDRSNDEPVSGARVLLLAPGGGARLALAEVDSTGAFAFPPVPAGPYRVTIQRIGYGELTQDVVLQADVRTELTASLVADALDLEPVVVTVQRRRAAAMIDFDRRRQMGNGTFITREDIERQRPLLVSDLFRGVPGVRIVPDRVGDAHLVMRGRCVPKVYIDGVATYERASIDFSLQPVSVEAIEVYSNATAPVEYAYEACGVVLVWTRVPQRVRGRAPWWKPALLIGGVLGILNLVR